MKTIMAFGSFDILHIGHIKFLENCKKLAEDSELIVVIARDSSVKEIKGSKPVIPEEDRRKIVESLKVVDRAVLGKEGPDKLKIIEEINPDVIALGYNQNWDEDKLRKELRNRGIESEIARIEKFGEINSSSIKRKILDMDR